MRTRGLAWLLIALVVPLQLTAQTKKRQLTEADYSLWSTMNIEQLSESGNWVSYSLHYDSGKDTLFVKNTKSRKSFYIPDGSNGQFVNDRFFICQNKAGQLFVKDLAKMSSEVVEDVSFYTLTAKDEKLIYLHTTESESELVVKDLKNAKDVVLKDAGSYSYNSVTNFVVYNTKNRLMLLDLNSDVSTTIMTALDNVSFSDFAWQKDGMSVAYFISGTATQLGVYRLNSQKSFLLNPSEFSNQLEGGTIYNSSFTALTISNDGTKVFFGIKPKDVPQGSEGVQLWNTADKSLYPEKQSLKGWTVLPKLAVWNIADNSLRMLTNTELPHAMLTGDQQYTLLYDPIYNNPQFDRDAPIDFYLCEVGTGMKQLLLKQQSPDLNKLTVSTTGRYIAYYRESDWWVYDLIVKEHRNLTSIIGKPFDDEHYNRSGERKVAGLAGWTAEDEALLIYDTYDVWLVKTDGSGYRKLTDGRTKNITYRIVSRTKENESSTNFSWNQKGFFDLSEALLLKAVGDSMSGYFLWNSAKGLQEIVVNKNRIGSIQLSNAGDLCVYSEEHYHLPPRIVIKTKNRTAKVLYESNVQQKNYEWGFSKLIRFENSKGEILKAALFYPAGYTAEKSYPMVVHIYELQAAQYDQYVNPTLYNYDGFNISNFTSQGYFVLLPDIRKEEGSPGSSAVDCVTAAVNEVLANESVNPNQVGLIGHSFGGYQTNFIITQTNMFKAAISGSGIADVISDYLYVSGNSSKANGWRYEFNQASIGISPFEDGNTYLRNSPVMLAKQIETPLLLWTGEQDKVVHPFQSLEMYLALRRLQKPCVFLLYEGNSHSLRNKQHQIDLSHRMKDWFDYYLKGNGKPDWVEANRL